MKYQPKTELILFNIKNSISPEGIKINSKRLFLTKKGCKDKIFTAHNYIKISQYITFEKFEVFLTFNHLIDFGSKVFALLLDALTFFVFNERVG